MRLPRFHLRSLMVLVAILAVACRMAMVFPLELLICCSFVIGPALGAWSAKWRFGPPHPDAVERAWTGVLIQTVIMTVAAVIAGLVLGMYSLDGILLITMVSPLIALGGGLAGMVFVFLLIWLSRPVCKEFQKKHREEIA